MATALNAARCKNLSHSGRSTAPERHGDGNGLYLSINPGGAKRWIQRLVIRGKRRTFTLGSYPDLSLADARQTALRNRSVARNGGDPLRGDVPDFKTAAEAVIKLRSAAWVPGGKSEHQWRTSLATYAYPVLGTMPVDRIAPADILTVVEPIWNSKRETAQRVRQRISTVLLYCVAQGHLTYDPAGKAVLLALPAGTARARQHHPALPYRDVPAAVRRIQRTGAWLGTRLAFEFMVLTAARTGEVRGARWDEFDLDERVWVVPPERMKARMQHRVPLSRRSLEVLGKARSITDPPMFSQLAGCRLVFPSLTGRALHPNTISKLCREHNLGAVPHGFRSSFRDWAAEQTDTSHAAMESALAHVITSRSEAAYARSDLLEKRRDLMEAWGAFVSGGRGA